MVFNLRAYKELILKLNLGKPMAAEIFGTKHKGNHNSKCGLDWNTFRTAINRLSSDAADSKEHFVKWFVRSEELIRNGYTERIECTPQLKYAYRYILNKPVKESDKIDVLRTLAIKALSDRSSSYQLAPVDELISAAISYSEEKYMSDTYFDSSQGTNLANTNQDNESETNILDSILLTNQQILETMQQLASTEDERQSKISVDAHMISKSEYEIIKKHGRFKSYAQIEETERIKILNHLFIDGEVLCIQDMISRYPQGSFNIIGRGGSGKTHQLINLFSLHRSSA